MDFDDMPKVLDWIGMASDDVELFMSYGSGSIEDGLNALSTNAGNVLWRLAECVDHPALAEYHKTADALFEEYSAAYPDKWVFDSPEWIEFKAGDAAALLVCSTELKCTSADEWLCLIEKATHKFGGMP